MFKNQIMDLESSKQQRKATRSSFIKIVNKLQKLISADNPDSDKGEILLDQLTENIRCQEL